MSTPRSMRTTSAASRRTTSTWRASRSQRSANSTASGRGSTVAQVDDPALGLGDDLLGHHQHVRRLAAPGRVRPRSARASASTIRPPRSSPGWTSGSRGRATASSRPSTEALTPAAVVAHGPPTRRRAAPGRARAASPASGSAGARQSSGVSRSKPRPASVTTWSDASASARGPDVCLEAGDAEARRR